MQLSICLCLCCLISVITGNGTNPDRSSPFAAQMIENKRVTANDHFQDVRLITFDISNSAIRLEVH